MRLTCHAAIASSGGDQAGALQALHGLLHLHHGLHVLRVQHLPHCIWIVHQLPVDTHTLFDVAMYKHNSASIAPTLTDAWQVHG